MAELALNALFVLIEEGACVLGSVQTQFEFALWRDHLSTVQIDNAWLGGVEVLVVFPFGQGCWFALDDHLILHEWLFRCEFEVLGQILIAVTAIEGHHHSLLPGNLFVDIVGEVVKLGSWWYFLRPIRLTYCPLFPLRLNVLLESRLDLELFPTAVNA